MKILMYHNNPGHLIIVDGDTVINGNYKVEKRKDGTYSNSANSHRATYVKDVMINGYWTYDDIVEALSKCEKELKQVKALIDERIK